MKLIFTGFHITKMWKSSSVLLLVFGFTVFAVLSLSGIIIRPQVQYAPLHADVMRRYHSTSDLGSPANDTDTVKYRRLIQQRIEMSRSMNQLKRDYGQLSCEMLALKAKHGEKADGRISKFGGWCKDTSRPISSEHMCDTKLAGALSIFFRGTKVASFGDGPGAYKKIIDSTKRVTLYDAYDGAPYVPETSGGLVKHLDLTSPQYGLPEYDWILSLEVAEHIPAEYESVYIDNIVRHAKTGVVLSWAVPGQGGLAHINNRPLDYVIKLFANKGFVHDRLESERLKSRSTLEWLRNNVNVYRRLNTNPISKDDL